MITHTRAGRGGEESEVAGDGRWIYFASTRTGTYSSLVR